jgi:hypothetical protein
MTLPPYMCDLDLPQSCIATLVAGPLQTVAQVVYAVYIYSCIPITRQRYAACREPCQHPPTLAAPPCRYSGGRLRMRRVSYLTAPMPTG